MTSETQNIKVFMPIKPRRILTRKHFAIYY